MTKKPAVPEVETEDVGDPDGLPDIPTSTSPAPDQGDVGEVVA